MDISDHNIVTCFLHCSNQNGGQTITCDNPLTYPSKLTYAQGQCNVIMYIQVELPGGYKQYPIMFFKIPDENKLEPKPT